jgi:hypothetical protein
VFRLGSGEGHTDASNDVRKARITSEGVESGIHPDINHSKRSLL